MLGAHVLLTLPALVLCQAAMSDSSPDRQFEALADRYTDQFPALSQPRTRS